MISPLQGIVGFVHTRVSHLKPGLFPECAGDCVGGVDPAVGVDHVLVMSLVLILCGLWARAHLRDVIGVDAVYGVTHVLRGRHHDGEGQHAGGGQAVVHPDIQPSHYLGKI